MEIEPVQIESTEAQTAATPAVEKFTGREAQIAAANGIDKYGERIDKEPNATGDQVGDATEQQPKGNDAPKAPSDKGPKPEKKYANGYEKEIARMTRQAHRMREELEQLKQSQRQPAQPAAEEKTYTRKDFQNDDEYFAYREAMIERNFEQRQAQKQEANQTRNQLASSWNEKLSSVFPDQESQQDYAETIRAFGNPSQRLPAEAVSYIFQHQQGPAILKEIADRDGFAEKFSSLHPYDQRDCLKDIAAWIKNGKPSGKVNTQTKAQPAAPAARPQAKAIGTVGTTSPAKPIGELSYAERVAIWHKTGKTQ
jgi:hypothetical protein